MNGMMISYLLVVCVLLAIAFAVTYMSIDTKNYNKTFKGLIIVEVLVSIFIIGGAIIYDNMEMKKKVETFLQGERLICKDNNIDNIVVSKSNGYELQGEYLIKEERAYNLYACKMIDD